MTYMNSALSPENTFDDKTPVEPCRRVGDGEALALKAVEKVEDFSWVEDDAGDDVEAADGGAAGVVPRQREHGDPHVVAPDKGRIPKSLSSPIKPSEEDVEKHYITHRPPRSWCPICTAAMLKEDAHSKVRYEEDDRRTGLPTISMDYTESRAADDGKGDKSIVKTVVMKDETSGAVASHRILRKGPSDVWLMKRLVRDIKEWGRGDVILKTDGEAAMIAVQDAIQKLRDRRTVPRNPPAYNPESNGACEKAVQDVAGQIRIHKLALESRIGQAIPDDSAVMEWIIQHAAFVLTRFSVGHDGMTGYERLTGQKWRRPMVEFGEVVLSKLALRKVTKGNKKR